MVYIVDTLSTSPTIPFTTQFQSFIDTFSSGTSFPYKSSLSRAILSKTPFVVQISDLPPNLFDYLVSKPSEAFSSFQSIVPVPLSLLMNALIPLKTVNKNMNTLVRIRGIVLSTSVPVVRPTSVFIVCKKCLKTQTVVDFMPRTCEKDCGLDPYEVDCERSTVVDEQRIRLQELFEDVEAGEMPRHVTCVFEGGFVDNVLPGEKVTVTGIVLMRNAFQNNVKNDKNSRVILKVTGIEKEKHNLYFTEEEKAFFLKFRVGARKKLVNLFAPQIHGNTEIKQAILSLLFAGRRKEKYGVRLRGDINILLLGDPGTAKSQLLKYASMLSSGVYTSGKGSSAAGLTASVLKNNKGEFYLEGGALVLSDEGVCCIDEFDKMDEKDRSCIHEAMEQQTVSINKAGINAVLNTRCAVLAAANPIDGRYDSYKTVGENIDFTAAIMSRFDCIFVVRDTHNYEKDKELARHVIDVNEYLRDDKQESLFEDLFKDSMEFLRKYITFAKNTCNPVLTKEAQTRLGSFYIEARKNSISGKVRITVRQLESLIRLSESIAKMELSPIVDESHVEEAINLFKASTIEAVCGFNTSDILVDRILRKMKIGTEITLDAMAESLKENVRDVEKAVEHLVKSGRALLKGGGSVIARIN